MSLSTAPAQVTFIPISGKIKTIFSDLDNENNIFSPEYVSWKRKWKQYHKWI